MKITEEEIKMNDERLLVGLAHHLMLSSRDELESIANEYCSQRLLEAPTVKVSISNEYFGIHNQITHAEDSKLWDNELEIVIDQSGSRYMDYHIFYKGSQASVTLHDNSPGKEFYSGPLFHGTD